MLSFPWRKLIPSAFRSSNTRRPYRKSKRAAKPEWLEDRIALAADFWTDGAGTGIWSDGANWSSGSAPTGTDVATFDSAHSTASVTIDNAAVINTAGIRIASTYTGTIDDSVNNVAMTLGTAGFVQAGGTFKAPNSNPGLDIAGNLTETGGTFTAASNTSVTFDGSGTQQLTSNTQNFGTIFVNNGSNLKLMDNLSVASFQALAGSTVDDGNSAGTDTLSVTGAAEFDGTVGGAAALDSILVSQGTTIAANITTTASQTYDGPVILGARTDLTGTTVTFGQQVNGGFNLFVDANAIFDGDVDIFALAADQTATIAASSITTTGGQGYVGDVTLATDTTLTDTTNNGYGIEFFGTVTGAFNLTLSAADHVDLPTSANIASLNVSGSGAINNQNATNITTSGNQTYAGAMTLGGNTTLSGANIRFDNTVDSATGSETLSIDGNVTFNGDVGDTSQLGALNVSGAAALNAVIFNTGTGGGTQTYAGPVTLGPNSIGIYASVATFENSLTLGPTAATASDELLAYGNLALQGQVTAAILGPSTFGFIATSGGSIDLTTGSPSINLVFAGFTPAVGDAFDLLQVSGGSILGALANAPSGGTATIAGVTFAVSGYGSADCILTVTALLTPNQRFVEALYHDDLGRLANLNNPSDAGFWVNLLDQGTATTAVVAAGVVQSSEARDHLVKGWYQTYLGRAAQGGEEQVWVNALLQGQTEERVLSQILACTEFFNDAQSLVAVGTPQDRYVAALYQQVLGRTASNAEVTFWVGRLSQTGSAAVALALLTSTEYRMNLFTSYYATLLHRAPDAAGLGVWVSSALDSSQIRISFEGSSEFYANG